MATTTQPISPSSTRPADASIVAPSPAAHTPSRLDNRWMRAVVPALLIHISIGTVYCWSVFKQLIADQMHVAPSTIEWGFSLAIFFLGMSAAFLGPVVEKDIRRSALISLVCFVAGFAGTGASIAAGWLPGVFICYGAIMGVGLGVGYLTPVKNLMLWFADNKGLATGIAVAGFGLAKAIASPVMTWLITSVGLVNMFYVLAVVYAVMMFAGFLLIRRPAGYVYSAAARVKRRTVMRRPVFWAIWLAFYLNITCGLALISQEKDILHDALAVMPRFAGLDTAAFAVATAGVISTVLAIGTMFVWIVVPLLVGTLGMAGIGTMLSTITMNTRAKDVMLAVLFIPFIYPLLYACVTATTTAIMGTEFWTDFFVIPLVLACGYDVVMLLVCWVLYDFVVSA